MQLWNANNKADALALNNTIFLQKMGFGSVNNSDPTRLYSILRSGAVGNLVLVVAGAIPGSICAILLVDRIGRKLIQVGGFTMVTLLLLILGSSFESMSDTSRVALFVLILFFINFGKKLARAGTVGTQLTFYNRPKLNHVYCSRRVLPNQV